ncbi:MAG: RAMP superfamily CRISPR-associated protein [Thermodesulfobacteriota bacterium]
MIEKWEFALHFSAPVSVHSGLSAAGLVDRMVVRDHEGIAVIPGSSIKGRWRFVAERLLRSVDPGSMDGLRLHDDKMPECKMSSLPCTLCKLFGNAAIQARLWIGAAELDETNKDYIRAIHQLRVNPVMHHDTEIRPGIALSRVRCTAMPDHLFFDETVPAMSRFSGTIMVMGDISAAERNFLKVSARMVDKIGSRKAVGRGLLAKGIEIEMPGGEG